MNYLSHYAVDHVPGNAYYNTGLILPDVCKKWIRHFHEPAHAADLDDAQRSLLAGALQHIDSDKKFHSSSFFDSNTKRFTEALNHAGLSERVERKWFIAHIAFELMIDRVLVKQKPALADGFYAALAAIDDQVLARFLQYYGMNDPAEFFSGFDHFREVRYLYAYADNNKFIYSLNRIMLRAGVPGLGENDAQKLADALWKLENMYFAEADPVVAGLNKALSR